MYIYMKKKEMKPTKYYKNDYEDLRLSSFLT